MKKNQLKSSEYLVLTSTEEKIVFLLESQHKKMSISEISKEVQLARSSIYRSIRSLINKEVVIKEQFKYFLTLDGLVQSKKYVFKEKIEDLLKEMLSLKKGEIIYSIESDEEIEYLFKKEKGLLNWQKNIADKGIVLKGIGSIRALSFFRSIQSKNLNAQIKRRSGSARFIVETLSGPCILVSFRSSIIFFSRKNKYFYRIDDINVSRFIQIVIETLYLNLQYEPLVIN